MWKKFVVAGTFAVVVAGGSGAALALGGASSAEAGSSPSASPSSAPSGSPGEHGKHAGKHGGHGKRGKHAAKHGAVLHRALHATWTTKGKDGKVVTHDAIRGTVTAASASSLTVKADDGVSQTYRLSSDTKVKVRPADGKGKATDGSATSIKTGQQAVVLGTGTGTPTAGAVVLGGK